MLYSLLFLSCTLLTFNIGTGLEFWMEDASCETCEEPYFADCELTVEDGEDDDACIYVNVNILKPIDDECQFYLSAMKASSKGDYDIDTGVQLHENACELLNRGSSVGKEFLAAIAAGDKCPILEGHYSNDCYHVSRSLLPETFPSGLYRLNLTLVCGGSKSLELLFIGEVPF